jgi:hypothetical protein
MKYEYLRVDVLRLVSICQGITEDYWTTTNWFQTQPDVEWRPDYQCFFILKGSPTHTMIAMKYGDIFE